ncbi:hypothetical protein OG474_28680 [Kribbella sp. NBC_01505]|uniref:hypothetical protein n=1 Tax=Kribbella sp. NBC_01505 TaxID=2903580 RepID=UPI00386F6C45
MAIAVAWLGFVLHNVADLPGQTLLSPETLYPSLVYVALIGVLRWSAWPLFGWAVLNAIGGGILSVLPLPFLPFDPDQTFNHYSFHLIYAATQLPLALLAYRTARPTQPHQP